MSVDLCNFEELSHAELAQWREIQRRNSHLGNPFLSPGFCGVVARFRDDVHVMRIDGGEGFFPLQVEGCRAYQIGRYVSDVHAVVADSEIVPRLPSLLARTGLDSYDATHLISLQWVVAQISERRVAPVIRSDQAHHDYLKWLRRYSEVGRKAEYSLRLLERERGQVDFVWDDRSQDAFDRVVALKSDQYRRTGRWNTFEHSWMFDTVQHLFGNRDTEFAQLSTLRLNGSVIAGHIGLVGGGLMSSWFPAYDPLFARYSPGTIVLMELIRHASAQGIQSIELGRGDELYKYRVSNLEYRVAVASIDAHTIPTRSAYRYLSK